jgi:hypothetical protein
MKFYKDNCPIRIPILLKSNKPKPSGLLITKKSGAAITVFDKQHPILAKQILLFLFSPLTILNSLITQE